MCSGQSPEHNFIEIAKGVAGAKAEGADYLLTPEMSLLFAASRADLTARVRPGDEEAWIEKFSALAAEAGLYLHIGSMAVALPYGKFANRALLFAPDGELIVTYDKIHLFDADPPDDRPYRESDSYWPGEHAVLADIGALKLGLAICYDLRFPQLFAVLAEAGAQILALPAAFTVPTGQAHWQVLLRARAIETGSYVIAAAQGGAHENGRATYGHSMIVDPWGRIVVERQNQTPGLIFADIDPAEVADARNRLPTLANRRAFSLSVNHKMSQ